MEDGWKGGKEAREEGELILGAGNSGVGSFGVRVATTRQQQRARGEVYRCYGSFYIGKASGMELSGRVCKKDTQCIVDDDGGME